MNNLHLFALFKVSLGDVCLIDVVVAIVCNNVYYVYGVEWMIEMQGLATHQYP